MSKKKSKGHSVPVNHLQAAILKKAKKTLPQNISFVDQLADLLNVSKDSSYRRINGDTGITIAEMELICKHYNLSIDHLLFPENKNISFLNSPPAIQTVDSWLKTILKQFETLVTSDKTELSILAKDLPVFYFFGYPRLSSFKIFLWSKSVLDRPDFLNLKFDRKHIPAELSILATKIWSNFMAVPSCEIWTSQTFLSTLKQIDYYVDCGYFTHEEEPLLLYEEYIKMLEDISEFARQGQKNPLEGKLKLFQNEYLSLDNTLHVKTNDTEITFINYNSVSYLSTTNSEFCKNTKNYFHQIQKHSVQISLTGERERNKFFNAMISEIQKRIDSKS